LINSKTYQQQIDAVGKQPSEQIISSMPPKMSSQETHIRKKNQEFKTKEPPIKNMKSTSQVTHLIWISIINNVSDARFLQFESLMMKKGTNN
jgi:hypothetical protein